MVALEVRFRLCCASSSTPAGPVLRDALSSRAPKMSKPALVPSRELQRDVAGVPTTVCAQRYGQDRVLVLVSQLDRVGMLIQVTASSTPQPPGTELDEVEEPPADPALARLRLPTPDPGCSVTRLLGAPPSTTQETLTELYARQIAAIVFAHAGTSGDEALPAYEGRPVVVGLALKRRPDEDEIGIDDQARATFAGVMGMVLDARVW